MKKINKKAFSLFELSLSLIIISGLMLIVIKGSDMINQSKITKSQQETINSPVFKISGLALWLEATLYSSFLTAEIKDGGSISTWIDQSVSNQQNRNNATQATTANQPTYVANGINGLPAVSFNGTSSYLRATSGSNYGSITVFFVTKLPNTNPSCSSLLSTDNWVSGSVHAIVDCSSSGPARFFQYSLNGHSAILNTNKILSDNNPHIISLIDDNVSGRNIFIDGTNKFSDATAPLSLNKNLSTFTIGAWYSVSSFSRYLTGNIGEIIIFNRALSDQERKDVEQYLSNKYAISVS